MKTPTTNTLTDCGSGQNFGICRACKRGHGVIVWTRLPDPKKLDQIALAAANTLQALGLQNAKKGARP